MLNLVTREYILNIKNNVSYYLLIQNLRTYDTKNTNCSEKLIYEHLFLNQKAFSR